MQKLFIILVVLLQFSCKTTKTVYLADHQVDCQGVGPQKCLLFKENPSDEWTYFYNTIEGFVYQEGYNYTLEVAIEKIETPMADESDLKYRLIKIIKKEKTKNKLSEDFASQTPSLFRYTATSRPLFIGIEITPNQIKKFADRNLQTFKSKKCTQQDWQNLQKLCQSIPIPKISDLVAPSQKRLFDGAAHAQLEIITDQAHYTSSNFDHGTPPEKIKQLITTILSLAESIE